MGNFCYLSCLEHNHGAKVCFIIVKRKKMRAVPPPISASAYIRHSKLWQSPPNKTHNFTYTLMVSNEELINQKRLGAMARAMERGGCPMILHTVIQAAHFCMSEGRFESLGFFPAVGAGTVRRKGNLIT